MAARIIAFFQGKLVIKRDFVGESEVVVTSYFGEVTGQQIIEDYIALGGQLRSSWVGVFQFIFDMSGATSIAMSDDQIRHVAALGLSKGAHRRDVKIAIVASCDRGQDLARLHRTYSQGLGLSGIGVFNDRREAELWLQLEKAPELAACV